MEGSQRGIILRGEGKCRVGQEKAYPHVCGASRPDSGLPSAPSLLRSAGDLGAQGFPRIAAADHRSAGVRARLPSPVRSCGRARRG